MKTPRAASRCWSSTPLNTDPIAEQTLDVSVGAERYTLTASGLTSKSVLLNGATLTAKTDGALPPIKGQAVKAGAIRFAPASITLLTLSPAADASCR